MTPYVRLSLILIVTVFGGVYTHAMGDTLPVFTSITPQAYFAERIGGSHVNVEVMVAPGQDEHSYEPTPSVMGKLAKAKVYVLSGMPFERSFVPKMKAIAPSATVVDPNKGVTMRETDAEDDHHDAHKSHSHDAEDADPHTWLDPQRAKLQARNIADGLIKADPAHADDYRRNLQVLETDLNALHRNLKAALAPYKGMTVYVYHPAFGYFTDAYGLKQKAVEFQGKEPGAKRLSQLIKAAKAEGVKVIFVQPQFSRKSADAVATAIGGTVVPLNPVAKDYMENLSAMAAAIQKAAPR